MAGQREIEVSVRSLNTALQKQNVYGGNDTGIHLIAGNVQEEEDGVYADTNYGRKKIEKASVVDPYYY